MISTSDHSNDCRVETAAIIKVELLILMNDRVGVYCRAEVEPSGGDATNDARFGRQS